MQRTVEALEAQIGQLKEQLSVLRRQVKPEPVTDYSLARADGSPVKLSELFDGREDLLLIHNMGRKCVYCTLWADGFSSMARHLQSRCAMVLSSPDEPAVMREFIASREGVVGPGSWRYPAVSIVGTTLAKDLGFEPEPGKYWPGVSGLHRRADGSIVRTGKASFGPGDDFCALWPLLDLLQGGAKGWEPKYAYQANEKA